LSDDVFDRALDRRDAVIQEQRLRIRALRSSVSTVHEVVEAILDEFGRLTMTDWLHHPGGPQPVADDVWVERPRSRRWIGPAHGFDWTVKCQYHVLNQHLIDAARLEGIRLGLEAAATAIDRECPEVPTEIIGDLDPATIAKEADQ
jgi:hypothetical protein